MVEDVMSQMEDKTHFLKGGKNMSMNGGMPGMQWLWQGTLPGSPTYG